MKILIIAALLSVAFARPNLLAPLLAEHSETAIEGEYVVVFKNETGNDEVSSHKALVRSTMDNRTADLKITHEWNINSKEFRGYAGVMDEKLVDEIRRMPEVKYVERNQVMKALQTQCDLQTGATWGLVRTTVHDEWDTNPNNPPNQYSHDKKDGDGITIYIIDTGIDDTHPQFQGRADRGVDFIDNPPPSNGDPNGHGTHVAGTVMADVYGLARSATSVGVRVLNAAGSGSTTGVIHGINYVAQQAGPGKKVVGNMSLGGGSSSALNEATNACVAAGVHMAVAAGNENADACFRSPSSALRVISVGATDTTDNRASFSNYGNCVHIFAPGVNILSITPNGGTASFSGTSMASPHVAGVIAKVLSKSDEYDYPETMRAYLQSIATKDKIVGILPNSHSHNNLLFADCE